MLAEAHTVLHIKNGQIWTTVKDLTDEHRFQLGRCDIHLGYLGRGLFVQLVARETLLQVVETEDGAKSVVELTVSEEKIHR